jgi:molecular chaperone HtpG
MAEYVFGANILENLTTGMYKDSKVIYREYIQNACDQIDKAIYEGLLQVGGGKIDIWIDETKRTITIEDNATGIYSKDFERILGNIADSDKKLGINKGFRGIGRLCGLAYCERLIFTTSAKGEAIESIMICDAKRMREMIEENQHGKKYKASVVLNEINEFKKETIIDKESHYFRVELAGINEENKDLLNFQQIKDYLSFVAPSPYQPTFIFRKKVYDYAKELGRNIDEYRINLNGETILKKYVTDIKDKSGSKYDEIFDVAFFNLLDEYNNLMAWMWIGLSEFKQAIPLKTNPMRGLRLRKENIQIGNEDVLQKFFSEDRGNGYFIGEVFSVATNLIPNSQRDYFNENITRLKFEQELARTLKNDLNILFRSGSEINSAFKKITDYKVKQEDFNNTNKKNAFLSKEQYDKNLIELQQAQADAEQAHELIEKKKKNIHTNTPLGKVIERIEKVHETINHPDNLVQKVKTIDKKETWRADKLSKLNTRERHLVGKIYDIISKSTDDTTAETIIQNIEKEFK